MSEQPIPCETLLALAARRRGLEIMVLRAQAASATFDADYLELLAKHEVGPDWTIDLNSGTMSRKEEP